MNTNNEIYLVVPDFNPKLTQTAFEKWAKRSAYLFEKALLLWNSDPTTFEALFPQRPKVSVSLIESSIGFTLGRTFPPPKPDCVKIGCAFPPSLHQAWYGDWLHSESITWLAANPLGRIGLDDSETIIILETKYPVVEPFWVSETYGWKRDSYYRYSMVHPNHFRETLEIAAIEILFPFYPFAVNLSAPRWPLSALCASRSQVLQNNIWHNQPDTQKALIEEGWPQDIIQASFQEKQSKEL